MKEDNYPQLFETLQSRHDEGRTRKRTESGMLKPMRGGARKGAETERGIPRRGEHQERNGHLVPGNTGQEGTDSVSATIPEGERDDTRVETRQRHEGQSESKGARGYHGGKTLKVET